MTIGVTITCTVILAAAIFVLGRRAQRQAVGTLFAEFEKASTARAGISDVTIEWERVVNEYDGRGGAGALVQRKEDGKRQSRT